MCAASTVSVVGSCCHECFCLHLFCLAYFLLRQPSPVAITTSEDMKALQTKLESSDFRVRITGLEDLVRLVDKDAGAVSSMVRAAVCHQVAADTQPLISSCRGMRVFLLEQTLVISDIVSRSLGDANTKVVGAALTTGQRVLGALKVRVCAWVPGACVSARLLCVSSGSSSDADGACACACVSFRTTSTLHFHSSCQH